MRNAIIAVASVLVIAFGAWGAGQETPPAGDVPDVNDMAPDFELKDPTGKTHRLSELRGKNVILEFIRSGSW